MLSYLIAIISFVLGLSAVAISFFALPAAETIRRREHAARTVVSLGVALISVSVAISVFLAKEWTDAEHDRIVASLGFFKSMLQYGVSAKHMGYILQSCTVSLDDDSCRLRGALAAKFSNSLPSTEFIFTQVARGTHNFGSSVHVASYLIEGETTLKSRMPVVVQESMQKAAASARMTKVAASAAASPDNLLGPVQDFQAKADEMSIIYCLFAETSSRSWSAFDELVKQLDEVFGTMANPADQLRFIKRKAEHSQFASVSCADVRAAVDDILPSGGGGN